MKTSFMYILRSDKPFQFLCAKPHQKCNC